MSALSLLWHLRGTSHPGIRSNSTLESATALLAMSFAFYIEHGVELSVLKIRLGASRL